jgi:RNA polymerase sigma-70 factor (ECF subfamily)
MDTARAQSSTVGIITERVSDAARPVRLRAIYDQYAGPLYWYALALLGRPEEAEDVVHDVFLALLQRRGGTMIANPRAYLFKAARRRALDLRRRRGRRDHACSGTHVWWADLAASDMADHDLSIDIERAVGQLPTEQREVLALKLREGLTFRDIGQMLGIPANTAASRYRLALARLRDLLRGTGKDE